jgi:hypothetical protein
VNFGEYMISKMVIDHTSLELIRYSDYDWCGDKVERNNTIGYMVKLLNASISLVLKEVLLISDSLVNREAEYIVVSYVACHALYGLTKNLVSYGRSKHNESQFSFLCDQVNKGRIGGDAKFSVNKWFWIQGQRVCWVCDSEYKISWLVGYTFNLLVVTT